jgi:beta-ureidopropionase / N-carbamoyl-L-amino-acid hydrolase
LSEAPTIDAQRVIEDLRELASRTSDDHGAQRLCWTDTWLDGREFVRELLGELGAEAAVDEAGNLWARLEGQNPGAGALVVGSHTDSVPNGGWLDGALGVMAAVGVLRTYAEAPPPRPLVFVDWADEEGARFGYSLFGSSAFAGKLDPDAVAGLRDSSGETMKDALAKHDVDLDRAHECASRRAGLGSYLELHIEQGPVLEAEGVTVAAVEGCQGIERVRFSFEGQAAHAGTTPMGMRRDAGLAAAKCATSVSTLPDTHGGVATTGELRLEPGISTAVAGEAHLTCDLRNPDDGRLAEMLTDAREAASAAASAHECTVSEELVFRIAPTPFDAELVARARSAAAEETGTEFSMTSGALHDAARVALVMPAAMMFCPSLKGLSHAREEDTSVEDLAVAIEAFGRLAGEVAARAPEH